MKYWAAKGSSNLQYFLNVKRKHSWFLCEVCGGVKKKLATNQRAFQTAGDLTDRTDLAKQILRLILRKK